MSDVNTVKWTRGFLLAEIRDCAIIGCNATLVDQGFDFSGGYDAVNNYTGNRRWTMSGCTANSCATYGFKFANVSRDGLVTGCIANNTGSLGFVFSGSSADITGNEKYNTQNIDVIGCKVVNVLGTGWSGSNAIGFRLMQHTLSPTYPRSIRFKNCSVLDTQDAPTTAVAYQSDVQLVKYNTSGYNTNIASTISGCTATSNIATFASGIGPNICQVTGDDTHSPASGDWYPIDWNTDIFDPTGLHNPSSNNTNIFVKVSTISNGSLCGRRHGSEAVSVPEERQRHRPHHRCRRGHVDHGHCPHVEFHLLRQFWRFVPCRGLSGWDRNSQEQ